MNPLAAFKRRLPMVMQDADGECGLACLVMVAQWHGHRLDLNYLRNAFPTTRQGLNLANVSRVAGQLNFACRGLHVDTLDELALVRRPAILHWDRNHFVVLESIRYGRYTIHDPAGGVRTYGTAEFERHFSGALLELQPSDSFAEIVQEKRYTLSKILRLTYGLRTSVMQVVTVALTGSLLSLALPAIVQVAIDSVVPKSDFNLLQILAIAIFFVSATAGLAEWMQRRIVANAGSAFFAQLTRNAVGHIFRLPLRYFESRHPGDVATRLDSIEQVRSVVTNSLVDAIVDGAMLILCGILMFLYIPSLAAMVTAVFLAVIAIRLLLYPAMRREGAVALRAKSEERSRLIDNLRAAAALKTANATVNTNARWNDSLVRAVNAGFRVGLIEANAVLLVEIVTALGTALVLYFGVLAVLTQSVTVGMLYAFFTYRGMFFDRIDKLVKVMNDVAMLANNMGRLSDFLEQNVEAAGRAMDRRIRTSVTLSGVTFRAGFADKPILSDLSLTIPLRDMSMIAIVGASGSGKTTLLKLLAGLYSPSEGQHLVDGIPLAAWGLAPYRDNIGLLLGSDKLLRGTVIENVTCFSPAPDMARVDDALRLSSLDEVVNALPRCAETMGSEENGVLSSGQRRRLMLARALYRDASLLLLDEVTSNLDSETVDMLLLRLAEIPATKLIATHDPRVIARCATVYELVGGRLVPSGGTGTMAA